MDLVPQLGPEFFGRWADWGCGTREMNLQGNIPAFVERPDKSTVSHFLFCQAFG